MRFKSVDISKCFMVIVISILSKYHLVTMIIDYFQVLEIIYHRRRRMPKIILQRVEEEFPTLKENMVSVLCMIGIVSSCSLMIAVAGVFDIVVPRQN